MADGVALPGSQGYRRLLLEEVAVGRADRGEFLSGVAILAVMIGAASLAFAGLFGFAEGLSAGGAVGGFALVAQLLGFTLAGAVFALGAVFAFAFANLIAKRMRDLGLPGWRALAVATALGTAFSLGTPFAAAAVYVVAVWLVLLAMPSPGRR